jgi:serine protease inhibitor
MLRSYLFLLSLVLDGCHEASGPDPIVGLPRELTSAETRLVQSNSRFAFRLFREISRQQPGKNLFISPLSVAMALGMTYNGASGATRDSMGQTVRLLWR